MKFILDNGLTLELSPSSPHTAQVEGVLTMMVTGGKDCVGYWSGPEGLQEWRRISGRLKLGSPTFDARLFASLSE